MSIPVSTLRPGLLVHIGTSIKGNVAYNKIDGETIIRDDGSEYTDWETERTVKDPKEQKRAVEVRSAARQLVVKVCFPTEHGLLCPEANRAALDEAFDAAEALVAKFNKTAKTTRLKFNALAGYVAPDDVKALKAINSEVRDLIAEMKSGIENVDVERVRDAASRAKRIGNMLRPELQERIDDAVKLVRAQAKKLTEAGEQAATAIDATVINKLRAARTAFLDLDEGAKVQAPKDRTGRNIDLTPHEGEPKPKKRGKGRELEIA